MKLARQLNESGVAWYARLNAISSHDWYAQVCPGIKLDYAGVNAYFEAIDDAYFERAIEQHPGVDVTIRCSDGGVTGFIPHRREERG